MSATRPPPAPRMSPLAERLVRAYHDALSSFDLAALVRSALPDAPPAPGRTRVLAIGKAAPAMARGALERWGAAIERALVVAPDGLACTLHASAPSVPIDVIHAAHPVPDASSVRAADAALDLAAGAARRAEAFGAEQGALVVLLSGGASALACAPRAPIDLATKAAVTRALLASGASIGELNTVRRHLSRIKGGGLARAAWPARTIAYVVSDVIATPLEESALHDVGSGPTVPDPTTACEARRVLLRFAPAYASLPLVETLKAADAEAASQRASLLLAPEDLARAAARSLGARLLPPSTASVRDLADEYAAIARDLAPGEAVVRVAEPSLCVTAESPGRGGRSCHLAALVAPHLPPSTAFLAGASDGVDGTSDTAGAVVDAAFLARVGAADYTAAVARFDTGTAHVVAGTALPSGPTGINLCDLHVLAREERP